MPTTIERPTITEMPPLGIPLEAPDDFVSEDSDTVFERDPLYAVLLHNDDINTMEWVIKVLQKVLNFDKPKAILHTLEAHFKGRSIVWSGPLEIAEHRAEQIVSYGPDPTSKKAGAKPLRVTIERVD